MIDLKNMTIEKAHRHLLDGDFTVTELVDAYLAVIKEKNGNINAYIEVFDDVLEQAKEAEEKIKKGEAVPMTGIPVALKDNMLFRGHIASAGSKMLENHRAVYDAHIVEELKKAGAVFLGRTNMDDSAMGSSTETSAFGITKNPLNEEYVPGGSSGGAVASVAMNGALVSLGTDTGGSIRQPASFTGLVGFKPTYGAVSRRGIISMGSSLDQVGPMAKSVADAEILFNSINSYDKLDGTSIPMSLRQKSTPNMKKIGVPRDFFVGEGIDPEVVKNFNEMRFQVILLVMMVSGMDIPLMKRNFMMFMQNQEVGDSAKKSEDEFYSETIFSPMGIMMHITIMLLR
jgi:aspartyl-tRNA(Asn)/glutamyl-tRNA(Gln) amidotransferase subunit A